MFAVNNAQVAQPQAQNGPDLIEIQSEAVGFQTIAGEIKLKLLPTPWPSNALPRPTSSLLSVASRNELLAAAGPNILVLASTATVRAAYTNDGPVENNAKSFTPELTINVPRLSHVTFTSDESFLAICAEEGGGIQVYDVQELKRGNTQPAFALPTEGKSVRALVPNPAPETGHVVAVVLEEKGQLLLANLKERQFMPAKQGPILGTNVSCISWSAKGKQLIAALNDGTCVQLDPAGDVKGNIPRPPTLNSDHYVSGILWLNNDAFYIIYTPKSSGHEGAPDSVYMHVTRQPKTQNYTLQKHQEPVGPFGMNRSPPHHFLLRLRDFGNLSDAIITASTSSGDVGLITCSKIPLSGEPVAANTANIYTTTSIAADSRRAQLPVNETPDDMSDGSMDTSPIGMALDLSSRENVKRPIPAEEMESSPYPLPAMMILNNQGVLSTWWFVYSDSIRQRIIYPGFVEANGVQGAALGQQAMSGFGTAAHTQSQPSSFGTFGTAQQQPSPFGTLGQTQSSNTNSMGAFGKPAAPAFGAATPMGGPAPGTQAPSFASFGTASQTGAKVSPWGTPSAAPAFGKPAFGAPTQPGGSSFGAAGGIGVKQSPWGTVTPSSTSTTTDKPNPFSNASSVSPFGTLGAQAGAAKPSFASSSTSQTSPFGILGAQQQSKPGFGSLPSTAAPGFGQFGAPSSNSFASPLARELINTADTSTDADMDTSEMDDASTIADRSMKSTPSLFPSGTPAFQLGSTFKPDAPNKDDAAKPAGSSFFHQGFGAALGESTKEPATPIKEEPKSPPQPFGASSTTPATLSEPEPSRDATASIPMSTAVAEVQAQQEKKLEEPPLPPSPKLDEPPLPPSPTPQKETAGLGPPALPTGPAQPEKATPVEEVPSPAGSPPVDLGDVSESAFSTEGSEGGDEPDDAPLPPDPMGKSHSQPANEKSPLQPPQKLSLPPAFKQPTKPAETAMKPPVLFSPPSPLPASPRSPSPTRPNAAPRSLTTPIASAHLSSTTPLGPPPAANFFQRLPAKSNLLSPSAASALLSARNQQSALAVSEPEEPEDNSDELVREELDQPIEPTRRLAPFVAHQDYAGRVSGEGVASQAERLYRDIQSMIDTLGLNARALAGFVKGHNEMFPEGGRERDDLEKNDWCLIEIEDLALVEKNIGEDLEQGRPQDVQGKLSDILTAQRDAFKLKSRHHDLLRVIQFQKKTTDEGEVRSEPLTGEQSVVLSDLRKEFVTFQKQLVEAEEAVSLLRAKLAARYSSADGTSGNNQPTVEAVLNTIAKMTRMIEQKSGDVDLLEAQMRKLKFRARPARKSLPPSSLEEALGRLSIGSGGMTPFSTPPSSKNKLKQSGYQLTYSDDSNEEETPSQRRSLRSSLRTSTGVVSSAAAQILQLSDADVAVYAAKRERRQRVLNLFKQKVIERAAKKSS